MLTLKRSSNFKISKVLKSGSDRDNATFENVYIFCEHVNVPIFSLMSKIMQGSTLVAIILLMLGLGVTMEAGKILKLD